MANAVSTTNPFLTTKLPARLSRNQSSNRYFTTEAQSSQSSEYFIIENSLLRVLRASAVKTVLRVSPTVHGENL